MLSNCRSFLSYLFKFMSMEKITAALVQPLIVLFITQLVPDNIFLISLTVAVALLISIYLAKNQLRSHFLYYWIVLSVSYAIIVFEFIIIPLAEITVVENYFLIFFTCASLFFLYLTTVNLVNDTRPVREALLNGNEISSLCPACRVKIEPRNFHCKICQTCISMYDHHSYWLNCCIGENNFHYYVAGIFFGVFALAFASLLILTSVCTPTFVLGILVPEDCTEVCSNIETCTCLVCGIYCMELSGVLLIKVIYHAWLISRGISMFEWREQFKYQVGKISPYSKGFLRNWLQFFKKFRKIQI